MENLRKYGRNIPGCPPNPASRTGSVVSGTGEFESSCSQIKQPAKEGDEHALRRLFAELAIRVGEKGCGNKGSKSFQGVEELRVDSGQKHQSLSFMALPDKEGDQQKIERYEPRKKSAPQGPVLKAKGRYHPGREAHFWAEARAEMRNQRGNRRGPRGGLDGKTPAKDSLTKTPPPS